MRTSRTSESTIQGILDALNVHAIAGEVVEIRVPHPGVGGAYPD